MKSVFKILFGMTLGAVYGMLFAQKSGKKLRAELGKSENPLKLLFNEGMKMDLEARDTVVDWAKNSEDLKKVIESGKAQFDEVVKNAKEMGGEAQKMALEKMEEVAKNATKAAEELKKTAGKKAMAFKKSAVKEAKLLKKTATKTIKDVKKGKLIAKK